MEDKNFGIPQISKYISNTDLFDGKAELAEAYANKVKSGKLSNLAGYNVTDYNKGLARVVKLS